MLAGEALEAAGSVEAPYGARMVGMVEEFGAYIVIAPGLALAHARPGPDVLQSGMSVVTLAEPVVFGHPYNDPVTVVLGLAVITADEHVAGVAELANVFNDPSAIGRLGAARSVADVRAVFEAPGVSSPVGSRANTAPASPAPANTAPANTDGE
ncbi:MAG: ascorbate system or component [Subtercola sp.]|nr:ascorbate system or component [Subtercola sp.]